MPSTEQNSMLKNPSCPIITLEEHYSDDELVARFTGADATHAPALVARLKDVGAERLKGMDEAGIDIQVLSHNSPSAQKLGADIAVPLTRRVNDRLAAIVKANPTRFAGFAALPTIDPAAAADELERTVSTLGFKGAMIHGLASGLWLDDKRLWPIFARAEKLDVPIYLHPSLPKPAVIDAYYKEFAADYPILLRAAWGYTVETATQCVRLVLSGVFDAHPNLKIIVGHLGEGLPFLLWRINNAFTRPGAKSIQFHDIFRKHFYVTTSGFFSDEALLCSIKELSLDRILFSVDFPFEAQMPATKWLAKIPLSDEDKAKIASGNAKCLLKL
jgi:predicted TIM-barrel fold metal-dependent hydrolase